MRLLSVNEQIAVITKMKRPVSEHVVLHVLKQALQFLDEPSGLKCRINISNLLILDDWEIAVFETDGLIPQAFIAPEVRGTDKITLQSQVYAIGVILYKLYVEFARKHEESKTKEKEKSPTAMWLEKTIDLMRSKHQEKRPTPQQILNQPLMLQPPKLSAQEKIVFCLPGRSFEHYEKEYREIRKVGKGGYGKVVLVESLREHKVFIAKKNLKEEKDNDALVEMQLLRRINHPNILFTKEGFVDGRNNMVMIVEFCGFGSLFHQMISRVEQDWENFKPFSERLIWQLIDDVANALAHCHKKGIAHLDMKAENLLIHGDGIFKLADFGISKLVENEGEQVSGLKGTPGYKSPEVSKNILTTKSDIWGLGVICYTACTVQQLKAG